MELVKIKKVIEAHGGGYAVLLGNEKKVFPIFVGGHEGMAMIREIQQQSTPRPLTHDLLGLVLRGFDLEIKKIVISGLVDNTFYATLVIQQRIVGQDGEWTGKRNEVRIDARPSDCVVLALKESCEIWVEESVFSSVTDVNELFAAGEKQKLSGPSSLLELDEDIDFDFDLGDMDGDREP